MEEWKTYKIGDLGKIITGKTPKTSISENYGGEIPFLTPSDDLSYKFAPRTAKTLTTQGVNEVKNCLLPPNSICVSCIGSDLGKVVITKEPTVTNQQFNSIIPSDGFDYNYIYYIMTIVGKELNYLSKTSTAVPIINKSTFSAKEFSLPPLPLQRRISLLLSSLDAKIETNRRINARLEEMAQALFRSWFIDFTPFKQQEFVEDEYGRRPKGWEVHTFSEFITELKDKTGDRNVPEYSVTNTGIWPRQAKFNKQLAKNTGNNKLVLKGNLVFGMSREILNWGVMEDEAGGVSSAYNVYHINEEIVPHKYVKLYIQHNPTYFKNLIKPAAREGQSIDKGVLMGKVIYIPTEEIWSSYLQKIKPLYEKIKVCEQESSRLSALRDTLLPKLMSGELIPEEITA